MLVSQKGFQKRYGDEYKGGWVGMKGGIKVGRDEGRDKGGWRDDWELPVIHSVNGRVEIERIDSHCSENELKIHC